MEGDIDKSHIMASFKKVHLLVLCLGVDNKYSCESTRGRFGEGKGVILDKISTS